MIALERAEVLVADLIAVAALLTGQTPHTVLRGSQTAHVRARAAVAWTIRRCPSLTLTLTQTGVLLGNRFTDSMRAAVRLAEDLRSFDAGYRSLTDLLAASWLYLVETRS